jgi:uncharacterized protein YegL
MTQPNSKQWSSNTPGYLIFLVDQSGSMKSPYSGSQNRATFTALAINRVINEIIENNAHGATVKNRTFISIIGYGGQGGVSVENLRSDYLQDFANNPLRIEKMQKQVSDGAGGLVSVDIEMAIHVEAVANGLTPMGKAFEEAKQLIEAWIQKKPDNPAPVVINISDGIPYEATGAEPQRTIQAANEIMQLSTADGSPLIFNAHISDGKKKKKGFEEAESELGDDDEAKLLFKISSVVPDAYKAAAKVVGFEVKPNSRAFVSNADPMTLINFINFGSSGDLDKGM